MPILFRFGKELFWTAFWVFLTLIIGFAVLNFIANRMSGNPLGNVASWIENRASNSQQGGV
jgi:hypothetical protein